MSKPPSSAANPRPRGRSALLAAVLLVLSIALVHRASPRTLVGDALLATAVAQQACLGGVPPENPVFAAERLPDAWLAPWLGGTLARWLGLDALHGLELVALGSAAAFVLALAALARRLHGSAGAGLVAVWLALAGSFAQGPLLALWRLGSWGAPLDDGSYLHGVVHPWSRYMRVWDGYGEGGPLVATWLAVSSRPLALAALAAWLSFLFASASGAPRRRSRTGAGLAVTTAIGCGASPTLFVPALVCVGLASLAGALLRDKSARREPGRRDDARDAPALGRDVLVAGAWTAAGLVAGLALAWPAVERFASTCAAHPVHEAGVQVARMLESGWLLASLAVLGAARSHGAARRSGATLLVAAALLCVASASLQLPERAENDLFLAALVLLSVPAAACALAPRVAASAPGSEHDTVAPNALGSERGTGPVPRSVGKARAAVVVGVFVAPFLVVVGAHLGRPPVAVAFERGRLVRTPPESTEARLHAWIVAETAPDAVLVVDPAAPLGSVSGSTADLPAFTRRTLFTERLEHPLVRDAADARLRHWIALDALAGRPLGVEGEAYLASLARELVFIARGADEATLARLVERYGAPAFRAGDAAAFRRQ